jgi:CheY-like chemotaxis protein
MVVDDARDARESLALCVRLWGHEVRVAEDGPSALTTAGEFQPDVALIDLAMPGMTGWEVAEQLRRVPALERMVLVAVTGFSSDRDRQRSLEAGFEHHLVKPVEPEALQRMLADAAAGGS